MKLEIYINPNWTYKESVQNIRKLKDEYQGVLSYFSFFQKKQWADFIISTRDKIYSLNFDEWQLDNIWNYMNNNFPYCYLVRSASRYK